MLLMQTSAYVATAQSPSYDPGNLQVYMYCVMHEKELQESTQHTSEHVKPQHFLGVYPQTPLTQIHIVGPHFLYLPCPHPQSSWQPWYWVMLSVPRHALLWPTCLSPHLVAAFCLFLQVSRSPFISPIYTSSSDLAHNSRLLLQRVLVLDFCQLSANQKTVQIWHVPQSRICTTISYGTVDAKVTNTDSLSHPACVKQ